MQAEGLEALVEAGVVIGGDRAEIGSHLRLPGLRKGGRCIWNHGKVPRTADASDNFLCLLQEGQQLGEIVREHQQVRSLSLRGRA